MLLQEGNVLTPVCDSVHRGGGALCPGGLCPGGGVICPGVVCQGDPRCHAVTYGRYASYWNVFLFDILSLDLCVQFF